MVRMNTEEPQEIIVDESRLEKVLLNLLTNARDALNERYEGYDWNKKVLVEATVFEKRGSKWLRTTVQPTQYRVLREKPRISYEFAAFCDQLMILREALTTGRASGTSLRHIRS